MFSNDIGLDLGTSTVLIYQKKKGIVLREPSVVAVDRENGNLLAIGNEALVMMGRTPGSIVAIRPLREGVIHDFELASRMITEFIKKVLGFTILKLNIIVSVPSGISEVEERAVIDAGMQAGARRVFLIEEPVAAALGAGVDITKPFGNMIVDIGGGTCDIAVLSLGGVVESASVKVGGDRFDEALMHYLRRKHDLVIGERTAEDIKLRIGSAAPTPESQTLSVRGRSLSSGFPVSCDITSTDTVNAYAGPVSQIIDTIQDVMEHTPPELIADIGKNGITLTGGGSLLRGLDVVVSHLIGIPAHVAENADSCVARGMAHALESLNKMQDGTINLSRKKQLKS